MKQTKEYKITIKELGTQVKTLPKSWERGAGKKDGDDDEGWGYTPEVETLKEYEVTIYEQTVHELDLSAVVSVVNKIGET